MSIHVGKVRIVKEYVAVRTKNGKPVYSNSRGKFYLSKRPYTVPATACDYGGNSLQRFQTRVATAVGEAVTLKFNRDVESIPIGF